MGFQSYQQAEICKFDPTAKSGSVGCDFSDRLLYSVIQKKTSVGFNLRRPRKNSLSISLASDLAPCQKLTKFQKAAKPEEGKEKKARFNKYFP